MPYEPWQPGMNLTAGRLRSISPTWQDWTPVWTTSTGVNTPSFGNAALACRYALSATSCWGTFEVFHHQLWRRRLERQLAVLPARCGSLDGQRDRLR